MIYRIVIEPKQKKPVEVVLNPEQEHYLKRVVRLHPGDRFMVLDGQGQAWLAELTDTSLAKIITPVKENTELPIKVTLMIAIPKGSGFEDVVRCCTELGVTTIIPLISDRTLVNPSSQKLQRWRKIAQEATEQSERLLVPSIEEPIELTKAVAKIDFSSSAAYIGVTRFPAPHLLCCLNHSLKKEIIIATGPEGGWTQVELEIAIQAGFEPISLGSRILRAITAPIVALSIITAYIENEPA